MKFLSRQEELLLLSILKLTENAYGVTIREHVSEATQKYWSIGAIYDVLDRLTKSKRYYTLTQSGFDALQEVKALQKKTWADLPSLNNS
jgi:DNA-binding PadR family transcriptional regulator